MEKKRGSFGQWIAMGFYVLAGYLIGKTAGRAIGSYAAEETADLIPVYAALIAAIYAAMMLHVIIHEAGHMVFGLLTGYRFLSFRIFSFMWIREEGRLRLRRMSLAGTAGQCLMSPPDLEDGKMPVLLYNFGGAIMNLLFSGLFFGISFFGVSLPLKTALKVFAVIGAVFALTNGIPLRIGLIDNDGRNALTLMKDTEAVRALWVQLKVTEKLAEGIRLKYMPGEWFWVPAEGAMQNSLVSTVGVLAENRLMDERRFEEAASLASRLLSAEGAMAGLHRCLLQSDLIYTELVGPGRAEITEALMTGEQKKLMKTMQSSVSVLRTEYALALLHEKDEAKAEKILKKIEKLSRNYPYPVELIGERELVDTAREKYDEIHGR